MDMNTAGSKMMDCHIQTLQVIETESVEDNRMTLFRYGYGIYIPDGNRSRTWQACEASGTDVDRPVVSKHG